MAEQADEAAQVRSVARELDRDRYLSALLAPASARGVLMLIAAFHGEIARIPISVREAAMGDIRLQWWRDALAAPARISIGAPLADAVRHAVAAGALDAGDVLAIIDAYGELLHPGALAAAGAVDAFADASQGAAFRLAARALGATADDLAPLMTAAAQSYGRIELARALPALLAHDRNPFGDEPSVDWEARVEPLLAQAHRSLDEVRRLAPLAAATIRFAILPVALVEPYLRALEKLGPDAALVPVTISPLARIWRIYRASSRVRF